MKRLFLTLAAALSGAACLFFLWYTVRLIWVNLFVPGAAQHRQTGMYIGAVAFPLAVIVFGWICRRSWRAAQR
ncbi:MAG TPA: hypothetical protein VHA14_13205 [Bryobacteraceae bacterium]|nr:hypothetical protein [Bryobacteraceae bacterium]